MAPLVPVDNVTVWEKLSALMHSHECWTYVRPAQRTRNGRMAYRALKNHYLGPNNTNHQANEAEAKLKDSSYHGEKCRWNFERYVHMHQDQHTILPSLVHHGYAGIDERSKVRHLLDRSRLTSWILLRDRYGPHLRYRPTSTTASCCSRSLSTT